MWLLLWLVVLVFGAALTTNATARELAAVGDRRFPWWRQSPHTPAGLRWGRGLGTGMTLLGVFGIRETTDLGFSTVVVFLAVAAAQCGQIAWHNRRVARLSDVESGTADASASRRSS
ncbi:hypothetical protein [Frigoribacterium sp. ME-P-080]|uniref:hypothetical protein n=1 Tax=Frigoribacterium sp. ME-P-080 TaxID=3040289 RepID=UPI00254C93A6|nr:hypothetical protein [Frigoribacterium sp. ME-P-080]